MLTEKGEGGSVFLGRCGALKMHLEVNQMRFGPERASSGRQGRRGGRNLFPSSIPLSSLPQSLLCHGFQLVIAGLTKSFEYPVQCVRVLVRTDMSALSRVTVLALLFSCVLVLSGVTAAQAAWWSPELQVNQDDEYSDINPEVAIDGSGVPWIVWMGTDPVQLDEEIYFSKWEGAGWSCRQRLHADNQVPDRFPEIASGKLDGVPWVVWAGGNVNTGMYDFLVSRLTASGWSQPETVFTAGERYDAYDIVARDTSLVWVVWSTRIGGGDRDIFARKRENGVWGEIEQIVKPNTGDQEPRIDLDSKDRLWVVWQGSFQIFSSVRSDTGWTEPLFVKHDVGGSFVPWIAIDDDDVPWMVWDAGNSSGGGDIASARWEVDRWVEPGWVNGPDPSDSEDKNPVIVSVPGSGPFVVWWGGRPVYATHMDIYESKWTASGWRLETCVSTPDSVYLALDQSPSLAVGRNGRAWVCWMRMSNVPPYDYDIWARYSDYVTGIEGVTDFGAKVDVSGVHLSWVSDEYGRFDIYRREAIMAGDASAQSASVSLDAPHELAANTDDCAGLIDSGAELLTQVPVVGKGRLVFDDAGVLPGGAYVYWVSQVFSGGCEQYGPLKVEVPGSAPRVPGTGFIAFPNPFHSSGVIMSSAGAAAEILGLSGNLVRKLTAVRGGDTPGTGSWSFIWDGKDEEGRRVTSGVYLVRVHHADGSLGKEVTGKIVLLH